MRHQFQTTEEKLNEYWGEEEIEEEIYVEIEEEIYVEIEEEIEEEIEADTGKGNEIETEKNVKKGRKFRGK